MMRILGSARFGCSSHNMTAKPDVKAVIKELSKATGLFRADIDYLFWCYCVVGKACICGAKPKYEQCVIRDDCNQRS